MGLALLPPDDDPAFEARYRFNDASGVSPAILNSEGSASFVFSVFFP